MDVIIRLIVQLQIMFFPRTTASSSQFHNCLLNFEKALGYES